MKTLAAIFYALCAAAVMFIVFRAVGIWVVEIILPSTGGMINAETIITWKYITPVVFAAIAFYFTYTITKEQ